ncbi:hypothetical protein KEM52_002858, partial [Ascosphaera acerosa]
MAPLNASTAADVLLSSLAEVKFKYVEALAANRHVQASRWFHADIKCRRVMQGMALMALLATVFIVVLFGCLGALGVLFFWAVQKTMTHELTLRQQAMDRLPSGAGPHAAAARFGPQAARQADPEAANEAARDASPLRVGAHTGVDMEVKRGARRRDAVRQQ